MSTKNHLKRAVKILREHFDHEILDSEDWSWNLKNYTLQFTHADDYQSVVAYKVKDERTDWNDWITLERRSRQWVDLELEYFYTCPKFEPAQEEI